MKKIIAVGLTSLIALSVLSGCTQDNSERPVIRGSSDSTVISAESSGESKSSDADYADFLFGSDVIEINITADESEWKSMIENAASKPWTKCNVEINGELYEDVGIKPKGNTSLQQLIRDESTRYSLKLSFGKYTDGQKCHGLDKLSLNNIYADTTYIKEYLSYDLMSFMNVPSSLCTFAEIKVNGEHFGFYLAVENTDDSYLERNYGTDNSVEAYKPETDEMDMDNAPQGGSQPQPPQGGDMPQNSDGTQPQPPQDGNPPQNSDGTQSQPPQGGDMPQNSDGTPPQPPQGGDMPQSSDGTQPQPPQGGNMPQNSDGTQPQPPQGDILGQPGGMGDGMDGGKNGVNLKYSDDNVESYSGIFDNAITKPDDEDKQRLIDSLKNISEGTDLEKYINVDEVLRYLACNVFIVNLDSYLSSNCHNYILVENNGQLSMLPWDYNLAFGGFRTGSANEAVNYAIDTIFSGISPEDRPIISKLLENEDYLNKYHEYLREITEKYVDSGRFEETVDKICASIDSYVKADTTSFDGYDAYIEGVKVLKEFVKLRNESVVGQLEGSIPSTSDKQTDSDKLIDASAIDMSKLGKMNNER